MAYRFGDVVLLDYPFTDASSSKRRLGVVLLVEEDSDILLARITSKVKASSFDLVLHDWKEAGLAYPSIVRLSKLVSMHQNLIIRPIGTISAADRITLGNSLQNLIHFIRQ